MCSDKCNKNKADKTSPVAELFPLGNGPLSKLVGKLGKFLSTKK
jgi:hypothetical protein